MEPLYSLECLLFLYYSKMNTRVRSCTILLNIFLSNPFCISAEIIKEALPYDPAIAVKEILAIFDILKDEIKLSENEDINLNITQLGAKYGYPMHHYHLETEDGYILTMFRIKNLGPPVLLMHGLLLSADDWVTTGPNHSLAYLLSSEGYDVWMGNARGNKYSRQHKIISPEEPRFWNFSWHEIGSFDLPAMIDFILTKTGKNQLAYIGHSQGTTSFFVMGSERPEYNQKISTMIALSPITYMRNIKSPLARFAAPHHVPIYFIAKSLKLFEILPKPIKLRKGIIFIAIVFFLCGIDFEEVNMETLSVIASHTPSGAALNQVIHYLQIIHSGSFRKFDYGEKSNVEVYGCSKPPKYNVRRITAPVALFYAENDLLCDIEGVTAFKDHLPNVKDFYRVPFKMFNHMDFIWAKDVKTLVYERLLTALKQ